jgi:hypothetical protein
LSPLVTIRVISGTTARCPITERGALSAESRYNPIQSENVIVTEPICKGATSVAALFLDQDLDRSQDKRGQYYPLLAA